MDQNSNFISPHSLYIPAKPFKQYRNHNVVTFFLGEQLQWKYVYIFPNTSHDQVFYVLWMKNKCENQII